MVTGWDCGRAEARGPRKRATGTILGSFIVDGNKYWSLKCEDGFSCLGRE